MKKLTKKSIQKSPSPNTEVLIATQSTFLLVFGLAAFISSNAVLENVYATAEMKKVVQTFQTVGFSILAFGLIVFVSNCLRIFKKAHFDSSLPARAKRR